MPIDVYWMLQKWYCFIVDWASLAMLCSFWSLRVQIWWKSCHVSTDNDNSLDPRRPNNLSWLFFSQEDIRAVFPLLKDSNYDFFQEQPSASRPASPYAINSFWLQVLHIAYWCSSSFPAATLLLQAHPLVARSAPFVRGSTAEAFYSCSQDDLSATNTLCIA